MNFSWFIAKRFILSRKDSRFINLITGISIFGIALGVATLVIAVSVLRGFEKTITDKIVDFDSHIKITSYRSVLPDYRNTISVIENETRNFEPYVIPFASKLVIVSSKKTKEGLNLIGIPDSVQPMFAGNIVGGKYDLSKSSIIIGRKLADKLYIEMGDQLTVFALRRDQIPSPQNLPNIQKFKVTGIFESGMSNYDDSYAYVSLESAQQLFEIGDNVTGFNIKLTDISKIDSLTRHLGKTLRYPHAVRSIFQIHRNIFTWIELQKEPIPLILALIILVAVFNIISTLLMIVLEKTNAVGVLKSIGAKNRQVLKIFLIKGALLGIGGIILGNIIGFVLMQIQIELDIIKIPSSVYFMSKVPFLITFDTFLLISGITFILCISASVIPGLIASRIQPIRAIRFR